MNTERITKSASAATAVTDGTGLPAPSTSSDGFAPPTRDVDEVVWYFDLDDWSTDSCTVTPWYYDAEGGIWVPGTEVTINQANGGVLVQRCLGGRVDVQVASVTGTVDNVRYRWRA